MARLVGLVLAGGASRRMGRNKAQLVLEGKTLTKIMVDKLRTAGCDSVLISGPEGIADQYPGQGPLAGIHAAFAHLNDAEAMMIVPVDMPVLSTRSLATLATTAGEAVHFEGQSLPLKLANTPQIQQRLEALLSQEGGDWSIRNFVRSLAVHFVDAKAISARELTNLNTPNDVKALEQTYET